MKIQVGPYSYRVRTGRKAQRELRCRNLMGLCRDGTQEILSATSVADDQYAETLLHEVLHAIANCVDLGAQEKVIGRMSPLLLDTLRRNPALMEALVA